jgi:5-formyltetrahydrofolate cyclo-ligase
MENNLIRLKSNFRKRSIKKLQFCSNKARIAKDKYICLKILKLILLYKPKKILAFIPLKMEVNIRPLIDYLRRKKICKVYVPFVQGETFKAVKYRLPLKKRKFGIKEPFNSRLNPSIDLAIIPIIGIDSTNRRVGFGKGMYDRFFLQESIKHNKSCIKIFTQLTLCKSDKIVTDTFDIKADFIITHD